MTQTRVFDMVSVTFNDRTFTLEDRRRDMRFCNVNLRTKGMTPSELYEFAKREWANLFKRYNEARP
jgi:hypothetical protein